MNPKPPASTRFNDNKNLMVGKYKLGPRNTFPTVAGILISVGGYGIHPYGYATHTYNPKPPANFRFKEFMKLMVGKY